ncbi:ATP-binding protein [Phenylobacterium sp.]|uniref:ATP-binding protein n=1 Tax=Phenylobacterium sp. TaxID=1871053 RepID=UPI0035C7D58D
MGKHHIIVATTLAVLYAANLWITNVVSNWAGVDTIWTANAFVVAAILLLPRRWSGACLAAGFVIQCAVILGFGHPAYGAVGYSLLNVVEAIAVVGLARRFNAVRLTTPDRFARLIFYALAPTLVGATVLLGIGIRLIEGEVALSMLASRLSAKFLGMGILLPALLFLGQRRFRAALPAPAWQVVLGFLTVVALTGLAFSPLGAMSLLALFPAVTVLGLRAGPQAVTWSVAMACLTILAAGFLWGQAPLLSGAGGLPQRVALFQTFFGLVFATGILSSLTATHQQRLKDLMQRRAVSHERARRRAEAASVAKTDFLATMSHEIRTPLNSIIGFSQLLERSDDLPSHLRGHVSLVRRSGDALLTVVNDILDFSKVEAGRIELDPKAVDLRNVCGDALAIVAEAAEAKGLSLALQTEGPVASGHVCDDHRLCQVLLNYLNNAVKFTDAGQITLSLEVVPGGAADQVRIAVTDTGVGIAPEAQPGLFERFSQVDSSVSRTHGGTGLGLAICKGLIETMGGRVGVTSAPGAGSTFWLELRLPRAEAVPVQAPQDGRGGALAARILLVDDHPMNRELGQLMLGLVGCEVDLACDGREAIEAARSGVYDAILMDVHMPGVDGLAATRAIRAMDGPAGAVPIIAMSADVLPEQVARTREAGMVDSVGKPIDLETLQACLARWVGADVEAAA